MNEFSHCFKCGYETTDPVTSCPRCRGRMLSSSKARRLGWFQAIAGGLLVALLTFAIVFEIWAMQPGPDKRWEASPWFTVFILIFEGIWIVVGLASLGAGVYQIRRGKRNKGLIYATLIVAGVAVFVMAGFVASGGREGFEKSFDKGFTESCRNAAIRKGVGQSTAQRYCDCALVKFKETRSMDEASKACMAELQPGPPMTR